MGRIAEHVTFSYPPFPNEAQAREALRDVTLDAERGEWIAVLGTTGSGKTTLCWVLAGLAPKMTGGALAGAVQFADGQSIGIVFQDADAQLFNMTVADEIAFGLETAAVPRAEMRARVAEWVRWARLEGMEERPPWQLSGGQKKRLALASVLALSPEVLVLDDPTAGLDPAGVDEVAEALEHLRHASASRHTVLLATADPDLAARYADRLYVMDAGRIVLHGTPGEVFRQTELLDSLGAGAPQMAQLADALRARGYDVGFHDLDGAERALRVSFAREGAGAGDAEAEIASSQTSLRAMPEAKDETASSQTSRRAMTEAEVPILAFENLTFHYPDGENVLRGINFSLGRGTFTALVGANGSGKTTLAKHANGLLRPMRGRVLLHGADIAARGTPDLARQVGYVFQNPDHQIFASSVRDEIAFGARNLGLSAPEVRERVEEALERFDLRAQADLPPAVLNFGARRLVTLAAVWAMRPEVWVLDEPTTGLDARHAARAIESAVAAQQAGATILLISHDITRVAAHAQRIVVVHAGQVLADGTPREVLRDRELLRTARLAPPPVTALAQRLGWQATPLTVAEFVACFGEQAA